MVSDVSPVEVGSLSHDLQSFVQGAPPDPGKSSVNRSRPPLLQQIQQRVQSLPSMPSMPSMPVSSSPGVKAQYVAMFT